MTTCGARHPENPQHIARKTLQHIARKKTSVHRLEKRATARHPESDIVA
ncbi:hypothetical protein [Legionella jamestowniensis]|nr:hypothetical protein [Legionella jamestowniensis]